MTAAVRSSSSLYRLLGWVVSILLIVALALSAVRLMLTPAFPPFEYAMPGFPPDPYGFTKAERLHWAGLAVDYLVNDAGIEFLGDLRFDDGAPVYNQRELKHMLDVKIAIQNTLRAWLGSLAGLVLLALWAWRGGWLDEYQRGLSRGGLLTFGIILLIVTFVVLSFNVLFVAFHNIFFQPGTWMFEWSDTLIRLFPERFWRDIFLYVGGLSGLGGLLIWYLLHKR